MITPHRALTAEQLLLRAVAAQVLTAKRPLCCREAAADLGVGLSSLRRIAARLDACGLLCRTSAPAAARAPRNTRLLTPAGTDLIALLDLTQPTLACHLLTSDLTPYGVGAMVCNPQLPAPDNLSLLTRRVALLRSAVDPGCHRPLTVFALLPDDPQAETAPAVSFADISDRPDRYAEALTVLYPSDAPHPSLHAVTESAAVTEAFEAAATHDHGQNAPSPATADTLLYIRLAPSPRAILCLRPAENAPHRPHPCGAPLTDTLIRYLNAHDAHAPIDLSPPKLAPLCRFLGDLAAFCHPDILLLEGMPPDPSAVDAVRLVLPARTRLIQWPYDPLIHTIARSGALLLALESLWDTRLRARP